jgi:hypothetical protein
MICVVVGLVDVDETTVAGSLARKDVVIGDKSLSAYRARQGQGAGGAVFTDPSANATTKEEESKRRNPSSAGLSGVWFFLVSFATRSNLERQENAAGNWA